MACLTQGCRPARRRTRRPLAPRPAFAASPLQCQQALAWVKRVGPKQGPVWTGVIRKFLPLGTSVNTLNRGFKTNDVRVVVSQTGDERWLPMRPR